MSRAWRRVRLLGFIFFIGSMMCWGKPTVRSQKDDLKKVQSEIKKKQREKEKAARESRKLRSDVDRLSKELSSARKALNKTETRLADAEKVRADAERRLLASYQDLREWRVRLSSGIRDYYMRWTISSEGTRPSLAYERALLNDRATSLQFAQENHQDVQSLRDNLAEAELDFRRVRVKRQEDETRAEVARARIRELQKTAEGRRLVLERQIKELNASAKKFEEMIANLIVQERKEKERKEKERREREKQAAMVPALPPGMGHKWRGTWEWPVTGPLVGKYGRHINNDMGVPTISNGVTLRPASGSQVKVVHGGEVLYAGPFMNYGLMALVSHPDHLHTIYAHLGSLDVTRGQPVAAGDIIGKPGRDDDGRPTVYFEIRVDGEAVNPEAWMK